MKNTCTCVPSILSSVAAATWEAFGCLTLHIQTLSLHHGLTGVPPGPVGSLSMQLPTLGCPAAADQSALLLLSQGEPPCCVGNPDLCGAVTEFS